MLRALIIDDEPLVIKDLQGLLEMHCPSVSVVGTATSSSEGMRLLKESEADLVFVDIQIDEVSGLELIKQSALDKIQVIFVTAHNRYAIEAFKLSAIDYLLKPVDPEELSDAVEKASENLEKDQLHIQLKTLAHNLLPEKQAKKIVLTDMDGIHIIDIPEILWCHANGSYTEFVMQDGEKITVSKHLKTYEKVLTKHGLKRVHRSYIVNILNISKIDRAKGELRMKNGSTLPITLASDMVKSILTMLQV
ncbi:MAG: LytTR family DNA-binding domain-containing protein [Bacteroidota bacterium]